MENNKLVLIEDTRVPYVEQEVDNIVAKRGALFMTNLKNEVQKRGFKIAHTKKDSIEIPNTTPNIIHVVMDYGKTYR